MKRIRKKALLLAVSVALILTAAIGGTIAYIVTKTDSVTNTFEPAKVPIKVVEEFDGTTKSNVKIQNTGNIPAFIRAKIVVTWKNGRGEVSGTPVKNTDYTIRYGSDWRQVGDFYYYKEAVGSNQSTTDLISECKKVGNAPDGYNLSVEIIAESIQSEPASVVGTVWGYTPSSN